MTKCDTPKFYISNKLVKNEIPSVDILYVTLLDALQTLVELSNNWSRLAILRDDIGLVVIAVVDAAQWSANCGGSALSCLIHLGKLFNRNRTALHLKSHVTSNLLKAHIGD